MDMFQRRDKQSMLSLIQSHTWPQGGWRRRIHYYWLRMVRVANNAYGVAAGLACGACVSFTPFLGFHIIIAILLCRIVRGHALSAVIGTVVGNPWTFPPFFWASYQTGRFSLIPFMSEEALANSNPEKWGSFLEAPFSFIQDHFWDLYLPTALGGVILMIALFPVFLTIFYPVAKAAKTLNRQRKTMIWHKTHQNQDQDS